MKMVLMTVFAASAAAFSAASSTAPRRIVCNSNPADFARAARRVRAWVDANVPATLPRLITVNSWNEWTEGSYLEPDDRFGYGYLDALRNVFGR